MHFQTMSAFALYTALWIPGAETGARAEDISDTQTKTVNPEGEWIQSFRMYDTNTKVHVVSR